MGSNELLEIVLLVTFFAHSVFSNLLIGGMPILVLSHWLGRQKGKEHLRDLAQKMRTVGGRVLILTLMLGLFSWLLQLSKYKNDLVQMMEAVNTGWGLLLIVILLVFWGLHIYKTNITWLNHNLVARVVIVGMTFGGIVGMTLFFVVTQTMIINPGYAEEVMKHGLMSSLDLPTVWPRFFHMALGGLAGTGVVVTIYGTVWRSQHHEDMNSEMPYDNTITRYGIAWTLAGTLPQIAVGPWLLMTLPQGIRDGLVDGGSVSSLVFFLSLTCALLALVLLNAALMVPHIRGLVWSGVGSLILTVGLMVVVRGEVRKAWISSHLESKTVEELSVWVVLSVIMTIFGGLGILGRYMSSVNSQKRTFQLG